MFIVFCICSLARSLARKFCLMGNVTGNGDERRNGAKGDARNFINAALAASGSRFFFEARHCRRANATT